MTWTCKGVFRLDAIVCNNKECWNNYKCQCDCKELIDESVCDKRYAWNPSNCECDRSCDIGEYLDYKNCKCRKRLVDKLGVECDENIDEAKTLAKMRINVFLQMVHCAVFNILYNQYCNCYLVYYKYMNRNKENVSKYDYVYQEPNYLI